MAPTTGRSSIGVRVRPNAHDFIRLLRAELGPKTYTFWADVRARTAPASKDVREWANGTLKNIKATVPVHANTGPASHDVAEWRRRQADFKAHVPVHANLGPATREVAAWRELVARDLEIKIKTNFSGRSVEGIRRAVEKDATVQVRADTSHIRRDVQDALQDDQDSLFTVGINADTKKAELKVRELFEDVRGEQLEMDLGLDTTPAKVALKEVAAQAKALSPKQKLDIDMKEAKLKLLQLRIEEKSKKLEVDVQVKRGALVGFQKALKGFEKGAGSFTLIRSLDAGPFNLGKPTGLIGTLSTITALAAAVPAVVTGIAALSNGLVSLGAAASLVPGAIGGVLASLSVFTIATKGVSDAVGALAALWDEGASEQASASRRMIQGQNNYRNALVDESRAQQRVADARREALGDLRNLNNELKGGVLNEAQALLDLQKAKDRYAQGDFENETDRLQGQLDIAKAQQNVSETREKNIDLQQRANKAQGQGVEGSDKVVDAMEAQTRASQQAAEAMEQMASTQATGALGKFNDQLAQLSPNAQAFVTAIADQKGALVGFRNDLQDTFFSGLADKLTGTFNNLLPVIKPGMTAIAQAMNENMVAAFDTLESPGGRSIIDRILGGTAEAQKALSGFINPFIQGFGTLMAAGAEHLPQVVNLMTILMNRFAKFVTDADKSGALDKFLDKGVDALSSIADIGINAISIIDSFSTAFHNAFGEDLLTMIARISGKWAEFLGSEEGQKKINGYIQDARDIFAEWKPILEDLPGVFQSVSDGASAVLDKILPVIKTFADFMKEHPDLVAGLVAAWLGAKVIITPLLGVITAIKGVFGLITKIPGFAKLIAGAAQTVAGVGSNLKGILPGGSGILTTPGAVPPAPAMSLGSGVAASLPFVGVAVAYATIGNELLKDAPPSAENARARGAGALAAGGGKSAGTQVFQAGPKDDAAPLPAGVPKPGTRDAFAAVRQGAKNGNPGAKWIDSATSPDDWIKRYNYVATHSEASGPDFKPPDSYMAGGYTPWPKQKGHLVEMHGKEFVQPADATSYYGVDAMENIRKKRIPKGLLRGFQGGGLNDDWLHPQDPNAPTPLRASEPNPDQGSWFGALEKGVNSGANVLSSLTSQAVDGVTSADPTGSAHGAPGVTPGPAAAPDASGAPAASGSFDLFGIKIPVGGVGWPGGQAPPGLGGGEKGPNGEAPFDMRNLGFGPGPPGSTPGDWATFAGGIASNFITSATQGLASGLLDAVGLGGILQNVQSASPLLNHFLGGDKKAQGEGAAQTNADVTDLLSTADSMADNPAYPGIPDLPQVIDPATGSALGAQAGGGNKGLQVNTARGEQIIRANFPWATNIGGVRQDALKWHPQGLALDVMTDPDHGNNDPPSPQGLAKGNQLYAWLKAHQQELGIDYLMWGPQTGDRDHYNHIHVNFAPSGYAPGSAPDITVAPPSASSAPGVSQPPSTPKPKVGASTGLFGPNIGGKYKGGLISFQGGGMMPMADPNYGWGPHNRNQDAPQQGSESWWDNPGNRITPKMGPSTGGWQIPPSNRNSPSAPPIGGDQLDPHKPGFEGAAHRRNKVMDRGGLLMPGTTLVHNYTGKPELVIPSFYGGGDVNPLSYVKPTVPAPAPGVARAPDVQQLIPKVAPPAPAAQAPSVTPSVPPPAAPAPPTGTPPSAPPQQEAGPGGAPISLGPRPISAPGGQGDAEGNHLLPWVKKGIESGAATLGNLAASAATLGAAAGGAGGGGGMGAMISGLFQQGGKIVEGIANVGASFLVGNITGGTTANAYGVTQRGNVPSGGTRVVDNSSNHNGDVYTNNLDEYFARKRREENVKAQAALGRWG